MADSTLDDFFAKKDKSSKSGKKSKYTTSATIAKKLEDASKRTDAPVKKEYKEKVTTAQQSSIITPSVSNEQEDEEWHCVEEKETDYSGLRIQPLSVSEREKEEEQLKEQAEQNGQFDKSGDGSGGVWQVATPSQEDKSPEEEEVVPEQPAPQESTAAKSSYVPPHLRNAQTSVSAPYRRNVRGAAPQLSSELHFPSLANAVNVNLKISEGEQNFQAVRHGVRSKETTQQKSHLDLENKFSALQ